MKREKMTGEENERLLLRIVAVVISLALLVIAFLGGWYGRYFSIDRRMRDFLWAKDIAEKYYYLGLNEDEFYAELYSTLDLDPYSGLFMPEEYSEYVANGRGKKFGIGVSLLDEEFGGRKIPLIASVTEGSPARLAGLKQGMYILGYGSTEEASAADADGGYDAFFSFLYQQTGAFFMRCGESADGAGAFTVELVRVSYQAAYCHYRDSEGSVGFRYDDGKLVPLKTEEPLVGADDKTAYIRIDHFYGFADVEFLACLQQMRERGREKLVLDLRSNGGGYMDILTKIAAHLLKDAEGEKPVVARAVYRNGETEDFRAPVNDYRDFFTENSRVVLLADEDSASASECLIGALVDYGTVPFSGIYLREDEAGAAKTFGKGIMQSQFTLPDGAAVKLTVATVEWPKGRCIHGTGVQKSDGALAVSAPLVWGSSDPMLERALSDLRL